MKVCIVTRMDYRNYGNRLQNYALTVLLENEGYEVFSGLEIRSKEEWIQNSDKTIGILKSLVPFWVYKELTKRELSKLEKKRKCDERRKAFVKFTNTYIKVLPLIIIRNNAHLAKILDTYRFDYYIAGSDQVWNPKFSGKNYEFLTFAPIEKRLSFAASFGVDSIPEKQKNQFATALHEMKYVSVRELQGVAIAHELTGRDDIDLTLDPTLLLEKDKWETIVSTVDIKKPIHFIATYFLGELPDEIKLFAEEKHLPILKLNNKEQSDLYNVSPAGFLSVLHDADYVFTDSFHALAFSIKFHREFYVFRRKEKGQLNMFSRLDNLLQLLMIKNRIVDEKIVLEEPISCEKWKEIDKYLLSQKTFSMEKIKEKMI